MSNLIRGEVFQPRLLMTPVMMLLLLANLLLLGILYGVVTPWFNRQQEQLANLEAEVGNLETLNADNATIINRLPTDVPLYRELARRRFVGPQDRLGLAEFIQAQRVPHRISQTQFTVMPEMVVADATPAEARFELVQSRLEIKIAALVDTDLLSFYTTFAREMPGQAVLQKLVLQRSAESLQVPLDQLNVSQVLTSVTGEAVYSWYNLRPRMQEGMP